MVNSMTGFGQVQEKIDQTTISMEVKTVNHRFLDCAFKMPREFLVLEDEMKKKVRQYLSRGRAEIFINMTGEGISSKSIQVNWELLDQYLNALDCIKKNRPVSGDIEIEELLQLEGIFIENEEVDLDENLKEKVLSVLENVLQKVHLMRQEEGKTLKKDVLNRIDEVKRLTLQLKEQINTIQNEYRVKIKERIEEHLTDVHFDESRIVQEVAILADKADITEEITRLLSHIEQVEDAMRLSQPIGRRLDFIAQELLRETNTIGSKSNNVQISKIVVALKSEIEKIKEQVQNIE
ncbi:YicC/YloC family endoribonuclease [Piscibacillus salipiscarius]|uniref:YicC/YloC family endoribonuclease n=1 Tax=Piscibacillus salipiscarius TaxID=299480 RepID=UPI00366B705C